MQIIKEIKISQIDINVMDNKASCEIGINLVLNMGADELSKDTQKFISELIKPNIDSIQSDYNARDYYRTISHEYGGEWCYYLKFNDVNDLINFVLEYELKINKSYVSLSFEDGQMISNYFDIDDVDIQNIDTDLIPKDKFTDSDIKLMLGLLGEITDKIIGYEALKSLNN